MDILYALVQGLDGTPRRIYCGDDVKMGRNIQKNPKTEHAHVR